MQAASDIFLGWQTRRPARTASTATTTSASCGTGSSPSPIEQMTARRAWRVYARLCGWTLARAHARSGDRDRDRRLPRRLRQVRPGGRRLRRDLRRPERTRLRRAHRPPSPPAAPKPWTVCRSIRRANRSTVFPARIQVPDQACRHGRKVGGPGRPRGRDPQWRTACRSTPCPSVDRAWPG